MIDRFYPVSSYSGQTFRLAVQDCSGNYITPIDVSEIRYSIYALDMGCRSAVVGHTNVLIPLTAVKEEPVTSLDSGNVYNFEYRISGANQLPFAVLGKYLVVFSFYVNEEPYVCEIGCNAE